jgi:hypothetical protein
LLLAATLSPLHGVCGAPHLPVTPQLVDVLGNLLLFAPLGLALHRYSIGLVLALALVLSTAIEVAQLLLPRATSPFDVAANAASALMGRALAPRLPPIQLRISRPLAVAALVATGLALVWVAMVRPTIAPNDLSNWELFPLVIGNEADGERSWRGTIAELRVYDRALEHAQIPGNEDAAPPAWSEGGPVLWMRFETPARAHIDGPHGPIEIAWQPPADQPMEIGSQGLRIRGGGWQLPDGVARHVYERLVATQEFSLAARVKPADLTLAGPARILSLSADSQHRDFTLGQVLRNVVLRVRTPHTGLNGTEPSIDTRDAPLTGGFQTHVASFAGERARIETDGRCRVEQFYPMARGPYPLMTGIATTVVGLTALGGLGLAGLVGAERRRRVAALQAGGGAVWIVLWALGTWSHLWDSFAIALVLGLATLFAAIPIVWARQE